MGDWTKEFPTWSHSVLAPMKQLDAADAKKNKPKLDGKYMDIDLVELARLYVKKYKTHQPGIKRVFDATVGLESYMRHLTDSESDDKEKQRIHTVLVNAIFEGAHAVLEGRSANYKKIPGFSSKFIDAEFSFYFDKEIHGRNKPDPKDGWSMFWKSILDDCRTDLFLRPRPCVFKR